jgi:hypothetical protein
MKSLSILVVAGTLSSIVLGAIFAITPASAGATPVEAAAANVASVEQSVAPVTGITTNNAPENQAPQAPAAQTNTAADPSEFEAATAFTFAFEKDTASAQQLASAEAVQQSSASVTQPTFASLASFTAAVATGDARQVAGIYVDGVLADSVVRQPKGDAAFVSEQAGVVTQFALAAQYGSQAFLAHNYLAGAAFHSLAEGDVITLVYGDGSSARYQVSEIRNFQALSPDSTQSSFVDLASGEKLSNSELFHSIFDGSDTVVLQTCIAQGDVSTWGRMFITAVPLS